MPLRDIDPTKKLEKALYEVAEWTFEAGEMLNAYELLVSRPVILRDSEKLNGLEARIKGRLMYISDFQTNGRIDAGFIDPPDVSKKEVFKHVKIILWDKRFHDIGSIVDVGCFSGWFGRNMSLYGYHVLGIDLDPKTIEKATLLASGTHASYEVLEASNLGLMHPEEFDCAVMLDVLEHVFDPKMVLTSVENSLRDGGLMIVNLPQPNYRGSTDELRTDDGVKEHMRGFDTDRIYDIFYGRGVDMQGKRNNGFDLMPYTDENGEENSLVFYRVQRKK